MPKPSTSDRNQSVGHYEITKTKSMQHISGLLWGTSWIYRYNPPFTKALQTSLFLTSPIDSIKYLVSYFFYPIKKRVANQLFESALKVQKKKKRKKNTDHSMQHLHSGLHGWLKNWLLDVVWQIEPRDRKNRGERKTERHTDFHQTTATLHLYNVWIHTLPFHCHMQNKKQSEIVAKNGFQGLRSYCSTGLQEKSIDERRQKNWVSLMATLWVEIKFDN